MEIKETIKTLNHLARLCLAGASGFSTVAENVQNRGLKLLLQQYAQQRAEFAQALQAEIKRLGGEAKTGRNLLGVIHRGRIDIMATLTIGAENVEKVALREAVIGEKAVLQAYQKALRKELPAETRKLLEAQQQQIQTVSAEVQKLRGSREGRLLVRAFRQEQDVARARKELRQAGIGENAIEVMSFGSMTAQPLPESTTRGETAVSGAVGGAIWIGILGSLSGALMVWLPGLGPDGHLPAALTWALVTLGAVLVGALFGGIMGWLIGMGIREEHIHLYNTTLSEGGYLLKVQAPRAQASQLYQLLRRQELLAERPKEVKEALMPATNGA